MSLIDSAIKYCANVVNKVLIMFDNSIIHHIPVTHGNGTETIKQINNYDGEIMGTERSKKEMGVILKAARVGAGYSQDAYASIAGLTRNELRGFENGTGVYNCHKLYRFTFHLGLNPNDVMFKVA